MPAASDLHRYYNAVHNLGAVIVGNGRNGTVAHSVGQISQSVRSAEDDTQRSKKATLNITASAPATSYRYSSSAAGLANGTEAASSHPYHHTSDFHEVMRVSVVEDRLGRLPSQCEESINSSLASSVTELQTSCNAGNIDTIAMLASFQHRADGWGSAAAVSLGRTDSCSVGRSSTAAFINDTAKCDADEYEYIEVTTNATAASETAPPVALFHPHESTIVDAAGVNMSTGPSLCPSPSGSAPCTNAAWESGKHVYKPITCMPWEYHTRASSGTGAGAASSRYQTCRPMDEDE